MKYLFFLLIISVFSAQCAVKTWTTIYGSKFGSGGFGIACDSKNNMYAAGRTMAGFDKQKHTGYTDDACLSKFAPNGVIKWTKLWGSYDFDTAYDIAFDTNNNIYVAGWANGPVDGQPYLGKGDFCLTKFNSDGTQLWVKLWGSREADWCSGIVSYGNELYISGVTDGDVDNQKPTGRYDLYFVNLATNGMILSSKLWGSDKNDYTGKICSDDNENFYITGETFGSFDGQKNKAIEDAPNIFSSNDADWKWNKKGTVGKIKRKDKSIFKIKGANSQKRKIIVKISDNNFTNVFSDLNINVNFSNRQKGSISVQPDFKGKF